MRSSAAVIYDSDQKSNVLSLGGGAFGSGWLQLPELFSSGCKDGFTIRGYINSAADSYISDEDYENRNFTFEALDSDTLESSEEESDDDATQEKKSTGAVKVIGISACIAAILGILAAAAFSGKKKKNGKPENTDKKADQKDEKPADAAEAESETETEDAADDEPDTEPAETPEEKEATEDEA